MAANKMFIAIGGVVAIAALTVGVVSAGAGPDSQESDDSPTPTASPDSSSSPSATPESIPEGAPEATEEALDDQEENEDEGEEGENEGDSAGNQKIAEVLAEEFDTTPEAVLALHDQGIGFGALFKLYSIARAKGITIEELLSQIAEDGGGFAFGKLKKSLTAEELAILGGGPKNLGELVSGANHAAADDSDSEGAADDAGSDQERGGPPDHANKGKDKKKN